MQITALINQKGEVGKTTSTVNIGAGLTKLNQKSFTYRFGPSGSP